MTQIKLMTILGVLGCMVIFAVQNYEVVEPRFLFWKLDMSRALLVFFVFAASAVLGWFIRGAKPSPNKER